VRLADTGDNYPAHLHAALLAQRREIERLLAEATATGEPMSFLERGRLDDHVAEIKRLSALYEQALSQGRRGQR